MDFVKKNDKLISLFVVLLTVILIFIVSREFFLTFASDYALLGGFVKFFLLASMGDFIGFRLKKGYWAIPHNMFFKAIVWGVIGVVVVLMFKIFPVGVLELQKEGLLPFYENKYAHAFFTSVIMNVIFAPTMMFAHRISDTYLDDNGSLSDAINKVDWAHFVKFVLFGTIPLFWIPAHTITFIIPEEYRIIMAAVLGIFLGLLLRIFKK